MEGYNAQAVADGGCFTEQNLADGPPEGPELFVATGKDRKQRKQRTEAPPPCGRIPNNATPKERMERKLLTVHGRAIYKMRAQTMERTQRKR